MSRTTIGLLGAGNMAEALLSGWIRSGLVKPADICASDVHADRLADLKARHGIATTTDNIEMIVRSRTVFVALKPQVIASALPPLAGKLTEDQLVVSVAAGIPIQTLSSLLGPGPRIIRAMPNTPALVGAGATAIAAGDGATADDVALAKSLFDAVGTTVIVGEASMDAVTGLSGSGPAYVMLFIEALADGGVKAGLPRQTALALASQTVLGAAELLSRSEEHPGVLKDRVTSPGGTTIAGVAELERRGFRGAVIDAVVAAALRSAELGEPR